MTKPKTKHVGAVTRAQHLLETGINVDGNERLRKAIEKDIALLNEVRNILYNCIENPVLPFVEQGPDVADPKYDPIETAPNAAD